MSGLTHRSRRILYAAITEYIATGEPVGSRRIAKRYGIQLSAATIRNVLADLEDSGLLRQPHTSAGRIPTDHGFRVFVDALVRMREVSERDQKAILDEIAALKPGADLLQATGEILSSVTGAAAVVVAPRPEEEKLQRLHFMPLQATTLLAVMVTTSGVVQNRLVELRRQTDSAELERVNNLLADLLSDPMSLREVRETLAEEASEQRDLLADLTSNAEKVVSATLEEESPARVHVEGQGRLFDRPEFLDPEKIKRYLKALDDQERLLGLLDETLISKGVRVLIGAEANLGDVDDVSVISSTYTRSGGSRGTLGVIGPSRMDYGKIVPLVEFIAGAVSSALDQTDD